MILNIETDPDLYGVVPVQEVQTPVISLSQEDLATPSQAPENTTVTPVYPAAGLQGRAVVDLSRRPKGQLPEEGIFFGQRLPGTSRPVGGHTYGS